MKLFKKDKKSEIPEDAVADKIAMNIIQKQRQVADYLNRKMERFTRNRIANGLIIFCIAFGCYCTYLLVSSIIN